VSERIVSSYFGISFEFKGRKKTLNKHRLRHAKNTGRSKLSNLLNFRLIEKILAFILGFERIILYYCIIIEDFLENFK